jgi:hypothetical protein
MHIEKALQQLKMNVSDEPGMEKIKVPMESLKTELGTLEEFVTCFKFYSLDQKR